jgi:hypothetical protein
MRNAAAEKSRRPDRDVGSGSNDTLRFKHTLQGCRAWSAASIHSDDAESAISAFDSAPIYIPLRNGTMLHALSLMGYAAEKTTFITFRISSL